MNVFDFIDKSLGKGVVIDATSKYVFISVEIGPKTFIYKDLSEEYPLLKVGDEIVFTCTETSGKYKIEVITSVTTGVHLEYIQLINLALDETPSLLLMSSQTIIHMTLQHAPYINPNNWEEDFKNVLGLEYVGKESFFKNGHFTASCNHVFRLVSNEKITL